MNLRSPSIALACCLTFQLAQAQAVEVRDAWVRAAVPGQAGTGAFMKITAREATRLVGASTPAAGVAEVHEMTMAGQVMQMRAVPALELPAGKTVELKPGGLHIMLMDLKGPLPNDGTVALTLLFRNAQGAQSRLELKLPVSARPPDGGAAGGHKH
jgi:copper(I)-binding protein